MGASFSLAFLLGPSVGAYFSVGARASAEFDPTPARLAMALTGIELALLLFLLPETLPARNKEVGGVMGVRSDQKRVIRSQSTYPELSVTPLDFQTVRLILLFGS